MATSLSGAYKAVGYFPDAQVMVLSFTYKDNVINATENVPSHLAALPTKRKKAEKGGTGEEEGARRDIDGKENVPPVAPFGSPLHHVFGTHRYEKGE